METYLHTFGYLKKDANLDEYDKDSDVSTTNFFSKVNIPLLIINAYDDPVAPVEPYLTPDVQNNHYYAFDQTRRTWRSYWQKIIW